MNSWADLTLLRPMRQQIYADFTWCIDPEGRAYFRSSRETQLGMTLEAYCAERDAALPVLHEACAPLERTLSTQAYVAGDAPAYVDYAVFSAFQWARIGSPRDVLPPGVGMDAVRDWRARMVGLYDGLGDRYGSYPKERQ